MAQGSKDQSSDVLEAALHDVEEAHVAFSVDLDGYEGPLHVLLSLARDQKVDLRRLSILKLAEQYLEFGHGVMAGLSQIPAFVAQERATSWRGAD
jgi:hypothetical protein